MLSDTLQSVQVGMPRHHGVSGSDDPNEKPWFSGFFKSPIAEPVEVQSEGLVGDGQADLVHHGGVDKAILCYTAAHFSFWASEVNRTDVVGGMFGENFTFATLTETDICVGDTFSVGEVVIQISQPRQPCWKLNRRWNEPSMVKRVVQAGFCGWYARVLQPGSVSAGMTLQQTGRPHPDWTVRRAHEVMYAKKTAENLALREELGSLSVVSAAWRADL
jgi:MOSC domain-containing protein YiiM